MKTIRRSAVIGAVLGVIATCAGTAHADVKVVESMTVDNPQIKAAMKNMQPEQRAQMAKMGIGGTIVSTIYVSGGKSRSDVGAFGSTIVDPGSGKITLLNSTSRTYSTQPFSGLATKGTGGASNAKPTGKTKLILGHLCRDYKVSGTLGAAPGGTFSGDIWAAADLPRPNLPPGAGGPLGALMRSGSKIAGMPLQMTLTMAGGPAGATTVHMAAKSVSKAPLPASTFAIPAGYRPGPAYGNPMMGGMGGGMGR
jgi:hypothetical protein